MGDMKLAAALRFAAFAALSSLSIGAHAFDSFTIETSYEWVEESDDPAEDPAPTASETASLANFGPFRVVASNRAELDGSIESDTPAQFRAMLSAYPDIEQIDMIDCPGTDDDEANFAVAHMLRKAGITTYVPNGGSVRSGGVELFLAGVKRHADPGAEFAVHSWMDGDGLEADDYAANDEIHQPYIDYYREVGMTPDKAKAFYAMTNSASFDDALYLKPRDIAAYIPLD